MQNSILEERALRIASYGGIDVYRIKSTKFKTNSINIFFVDVLDKKNAAKNALLPAVLRRGCNKLPTFKDIALYLEELYGASFDCGVFKKGERQIVQFYIEFVNDKYLEGGSRLFEKAFELLYDIITDPILDKSGTFLKEYIEQEKENLKRLIESRINDKMQYAVEKCMEEMCRDEAFGIYEYGSTKDLESINPENLRAQHAYFLEHLPVQIYIAGDIEEGRIMQVLERFSGIGRGTVKNTGIDAVEKQILQTREVTENMNVNQGKLSLGFRTNVAPDDRNYYALMVYNGILGGRGGVHSKLFQKVREKESLAYYIFSMLEKFKGLMVVSCGIESGNRDRVVGMILEEMEEIRKGNITDYEYESTLKNIETGIKSLKDSQIQIVDFYLGQNLANTRDDLDAMIDSIGKVTKRDVVDISGKVRLDTVYFLTSADNGRE